VQTGDTLPALSAHFNTTVDEILEANPAIPKSATTLPPGMPIQVPIYYQPLWGSAIQIIPDNSFINGPDLLDFNTSDFVNSHSGWLKSNREYAGGAWRTGGELIDYVAINFSISPKLLLAIVEYQAQGLSSPTFEGESFEYTLNYIEPFHQGFYSQLVWAANALNNGYYGWRTGDLKSYELEDHSVIFVDPWQNAASAGLQYYFSQVMDPDQYHQAIGETGFLATYQSLFGDPWESQTPHIPGSLEQPEMRLPFLPGAAWAYTGGPHTGWGEGEPRAAIDFAPPGIKGGCTPTTQWAVALAEGVIARKETAIAVLDLDMDGDERTGWVVFYLHLATDSIPSAGTHLNSGDRIGLPSCEGGRSTGTHVHIARKYNGEWVPADGPLAFNLEGWVAQDGDDEYQGKLVRFSQSIRACICSDQPSQIASDIYP
jgi:murein DD-endopeptidase MepM/ murein hydrolase activator NlpD